MALGVCCVLVGITKMIKKSSGTMPLSIRMMVGYGFRHRKYKRKKGNYSEESCELQLFLEVT